MKRIYQSALAFSLGIIAWRLIAYFILDNTSIASVVEDIHLVLMLFLFAFMNRHLEVHKEQLKKVQEDLEKTKNQLKIQNDSAEKQLNFFNQ